MTIRSEKEILKRLEEIEFKITESISFREKHTDKDMYISLANLAKWVLGESE
jgi:hypothetical protein